jgi:hypothetical protein
MQGGCSRHVAPFAARNIREVLRFILTGVNCILINANCQLLTADCQLRTEDSLPSLRHTEPQAKNLGTAPVGKVLWY